MSTENLQKKEVSTWRLAGWSMHQTASSIIGLAMTFVSYLAAGGYGVTVVVAGMLATWMRLFDGLIDPFLALITDRVNSKFGRLRILTVIGRGIQVLCLLILYFFGIGKGVVVYAVTTSVYYIGASIAAIATHTGNALITTDPKRRPLVFRWNLTFTMFISTLFSLYRSKILYPKYGSLGIPAFQELCVTAIVVCLLMEVVAMFSVSPLDKPENFPKKKSGKGPSLLDTWHVLKDNRAMQTYLLAAVSDKIATNAAKEATITTLLWGVVINNYEWNGTLSAIQLPFSLAMLWIGTYFNAKTGAKKAVVRYSVINLVLAACMMLLFVCVDPTSITHAAIPTAIFVVLTLCRTAMTTVMNSATQSMIPDIIDYELYRSGAYVPGIIGTTQSLVDELFTSLSPTLAAIGIAMVGYTEVMPQPGDPSSPAIFWMTMFLWLGLPVIGWLLNFVAMKYYPLTPEMMVEVQKSNEKFRAEMSAEAAKK